MQHLDVLLMFQEATLVLSDTEMLIQGFESFQGWVLNRLAGLPCSFFVGLRRSWVTQSFFAHPRYLTCWSLFCYLPVLGCKALHKQENVTFQHSPAAAFLPSWPLLGVLLGLVMGYLLCLDSGLQDWILPKHPPWGIRRSPILFVVRICLETALQKTFC